MKIVIIVYIILLMITSLYGKDFPSEVETLKQRKISAQINAAKADINQNLTTAFKLYYLDNNTYPTTKEGFKALFEKPKSASNWNGPYLNNKKDLVDPWGVMYIYRYPSKSTQEVYFDLYSLGPDGLDGTKDDIIAQIPEQIVKIMFNNAELGQLIKDLENIINISAFNVLSSKPLPPNGGNLVITTSEHSKMFEFTKELQRSLLVKEVKIMYSTRSESETKFEIKLYFTKQAKNKNVKDKKLMQLKENFLKIF